MTVLGGGGGGALRVACHPTRWVAAPRARVCPRRLGPPPLARTSPPRAGSLPLSAHVALRDRWTLPVETRNTSVISDKKMISPRTFPEPEYKLPIYEPLTMDLSKAPRPVRDLIRDFKQPSVTDIHNSTMLPRHQTLSVRTLRV